MADIIPNDLSHMSDEDFNALCPQGHHAPGPEPLSPAANAVLDAYMNNCGWLDGPLDRDYRCAAAVLRAAADQVVPGDYDPPRGVPYPEKEAFVDGKCVRNEDIRAELLAIADELEGSK